MFKNNITKIIALTAISLTTLGITACTQSGTSLPPGKYETSTKSTDANGTTYKTDRTTDVDVDSNGNKSATVKTKTSTDPKGLFNKSTTSSTTTTKTSY